MSDLNPELGDLATKTDLQLGDLAERVFAEQERRRVLEQAEAAASDLARQFEEAVAVSPPVTDLTATVGPGQRFVWTDGNIWRNKTTTWLSLAVAGPDVYPLGYAQETGLPEEVPPFVAGEQVWAAGDALNPDPAKAATLREFGGIIYRCIQSHVTQAGWTPPAVPALWTPQGSA